MTGQGLNAGAAGAVGRALPFSGAGRHGGPILLTGVSLLALAASGLATPAHAATFFAANENELYSAIADAQASPDATSTITLTGSFAITSPLPAIAGRDITVVTGANTLSYSSAVSLDIAADASLTLSGNIQGTGVLNSGLLTKVGGGEFIIDGATGSGITRIGLDGGHTLIEGGSEITFGTTTGGTVEQLNIAEGAGQVASLTVSGAGTKLVATGTDQTDLSNGGSGSQATLTIEEGASYSTAGAIRLHSPGSGGTATVNILGEGSTLEAGGFTSANGTSYINVRGGGVVDISGATSFGGVANTSWADANVTAEISGEGSRWDSGATIAMFQGSLSILDGGVMSGTTVNISTSQGAVLPNFGVLVSGDGSALSGTTVNLGTRGTGVLTIADDGVVVVNGGNSALIVGGVHASSNAALNIGGAVGEAAAAAGTLEASAVTLAASAEINFNHTETGYVFDLPINGGGAINQVAGHTIFNANQLGFTGLTTIGGGMLEVNGELGGTVDVLGGTLAGIGTVGATSLAAAGAISPGGGNIGELTIDGDYLGSGGLLQIQTVLGDDTSDTDRLVIAGNTDGTTNVAVTNLGGAGGVTSTGIKIIDVGGTSDGIFNLFGDVVVNGEQAVIGGAYLYGLYQETADGDWYLRNILNPDDPGTPLFQPAAPVFEAYAGALQTFNKPETLQQRLGNRSWMGGEVEGNGLWGRIVADHTAIDPEASTTGASYDATSWRLQAGLDGVLNQSEAGTLIGGVNAQVGTVSADIGSAFGTGGIESNGYGLGATLTWYGNEGFYLDAQGKLTWFDSTLTSDTLGTLVSGNRGFGSVLSLEAGRQLALGDNWSVTPQAQLTYSAVDFDDFINPFDSAVVLVSGDSLLGRLGITADYETEWQDTSGEIGRSHFYGIANLSYQFLDGNETAVGSDTLSSQADPLWGGVGIGGSMNWSEDAMSIYGEASLNTSLNNLGDSYSVGATAGIRGKF